MPTLTTATETLRIARQPILSSAGVIFGYKLLYGAAGNEIGLAPREDAAAARVLTDALLGVGLERLTDGRPAFLSLTRTLLLSDACTLIPPAAAVLEIRGDITVDSDVIAACRDLQHRGYLLALDGFLPDSPSEQLLPYARFVKIDALATPARRRTAVAKRLRPQGLRLIAEKVETRKLAQATESAGYEFFQGFYFCQPPVLKAKSPPGRQLAYLNLLAMLSKSDLGMGELEDLIKHDASMTLRVLQCVNSAAFGVRREIGSLREALVLLGTNTIARWAMVWSMAGMNEGPTEVVTLAILRGRCCELMGDRLKRGNGANLFLLGLCSLLETMLGVPMIRAIEELPLAAEIRLALLGSPGAERTLLDAVMAHERGDWDRAERIADPLDLPAGTMDRAYNEALRWASDLSAQTR